MERSGHPGRGGAALAVACVAACFALLGVAAPASARLAETLRYAKADLVLDQALLEALGEQGVHVSGLGPAKLDGRALRMPVSNAFLEYGGGSGYAFMRGGLKLRGPRGSVTLRSLVLNTAKDRFNANVDGRSTVLASPEGINGTPTRYGLEVTVRRLVLSGAGARVLNRSLGLHRVFAAGASLARVRVSGESPTVPLDLSRFEFSFDEGFRQKLAGLGISISPVGAATQLGTAPLGFSFPDAGGDTNRGLGRGGIASPSYLHLSEGAFPNQHEANLGISISFESTLAGHVSAGGSPAFGGSPLGEANFAGIAKLDSAGMAEAPPTLLTLSSYGAPVLNGALGGGAAPFSVGEPLGTIAFAGRLGR